MIHLWLVGCSRVPGGNFGGKKVSVASLFRTPPPPNRGICSSSETVIRAIDSGIGSIISLNRRQWGHSDVQLRAQVCWRERCQDLAKKAFLHPESISLTQCPLWDNFYPTFLNWAIISGSPDFILTPVPRPGFEPTTVELHRDLWRTLYRLNYLAAS